MKALVTLVALLLLNDDKLAFEPVKDFAPISQVFVAANILAVHPDVPAKNVEELVALARAQPDKLTYGLDIISNSPTKFAAVIRSEIPE